MQEIQSFTNLGTPIEQDEVGLLDILLTLAENAKLLIVGSLFVGLCALGIGYVLPQTFESVAVLQVEQATASLISTASVLDPVAFKLGLTKDASVEEARSELRQSIKTAVGKYDKLITLTVSASTPQQAQARANAVLEQTYLQSIPKGSVRARLEVQLEEAQVRLKNAQSAATTMFKRLESPTTTTTTGTDLIRSVGYAELLGATATAQTQIIGLESQLEGLSEAQLIQAPTLPEKASQPKKALLAIGATLATGLLLLFFIFIRQALRNTAADVEAAGKLVRIRRALGLN